MKSTLTIFSIAIFACSMIQCSKSNTAFKFPDDPYSRLKEGNERFYAGRSAHPDISIDRVKELSKEQHPFAIVISCSDSRAPDEIVFDQGLGDLFVIRPAGNVIADIGLGSIEYAAEHANVKYILVTGHEGCGAVKAAGYPPFFL